VSGPPSRRTVLAAAVAAGLAGCSRGTPLVERMVIAGGQPGGFYLEFARLLSEQLTAARVAGRVEVRPTEGSLQNLGLLGSGGADVALCLADAAVARPGPVALGRVYENYLQCVVRRDGPLRALPDLAGRRLSTGPPGAGAALTSERLLGIAGLRSGRAPRIQHLGLSVATEALAGNRLDAMLWSGGVPTRALSELATRVPLRLLPLDQWIRALRRSYGAVYQRVQIPAGTYGFAPAVGTVGVSNLLLSRPNLPDDVAAAVVGVMVARAALLVPASAVGAQFLDAESLIGTAPLPLHPGAVRRYRELHG
jgi:TRAP transporter TAXI family solute receptor